MITNSQTNDHEGEVVVGHGTGGGYFGASRNYQFGSPLRSVTIADYNRDGGKDIAVIAISDFAVKAMLNNGGATF